MQPSQDIKAGKTGSSKPIRRMVYRSLRNGAVAFVVLTAICWLATDRADTLSLTAIAGLHDVPLEGHEALVRLALFGGLVVSAIQTAISFTVLSLVFMSIRVAVRSLWTLWQARRHPVSAPLSSLSMEASDVR